MNLKNLFKKEKNSQSVKEFFEKLQEDGWKGLCLLQNEKEDYDITFLKGSQDDFYLSLIDLIERCEKTDKEASKSLIDATSAVGSFFFNGNDAERLFAKIENSEFYGFCVLAKGKEDNKDANITALTKGEEKDLFVALAGLMTTLAKNDKKRYEMMYNTMSGVINLCNEGVFKKYYNVN